MNLSSLEPIINDAAELGAGNMTEGYRTEYIRGFKKGAQFILVDKLIVENELVETLTEAEQFISGFEDDDGL